MSKVSVIYHSSYGHLMSLAQHIAAGAQDAGAEVRVCRVPELVSPEVIAGNAGLQHGQDLQKDIPFATLEDLTWADAVAFGAGTRYGHAASQLLNFMDQTGTLWQSGALVGKLAGFFTGAATLHGGHETTILTLSTFAYHMGMLIVPTGYDTQEMFATQGGGSPYGPSALSGGDGSRQLDEHEIAIARHLGSKLAKYADKLSQ